MRSLPSRADTRTPDAQRLAPRHARAGVNRECRAVAVVTPVTELIVTAMGMQFLLTGLRAFLHLQPVDGPAIAQSSQGQAQPLKAPSLAARNRLSMREANRLSYDFPAPR